MIVRSARPDAHFTVLRNDVLRDERLSYRARGVLAAILSQPDDWRTSVEALGRAGKEGESAIRTALAELERAGYVSRAVVRGSNGQVTTVTTVYDQAEHRTHRLQPVDNAG